MQREKHARPSGTRAERLTTPGARAEVISVIDDSYLKQPGPILSDARKLVALEAGRRDLRTSLPTIAADFSVGHVYYRHVITMAELIFVGSRPIAALSGISSDCS